MAGSSLFALIDDIATLLDDVSVMTKVAAKKKQDSDVKMLASAVDLDDIARNFTRFAGTDDVMDAHEFEKFTKDVNITRQQASSLWAVLDRDGSGSVEKEEFTRALANMQQARAWSRYCVRAGGSS